MTIQSQPPGNSPLGKVSIRIEDRKMKRTTGNHETEPGQEYVRIHQNIRREDLADQDRSDEILTKINRRLPERAQWPSSDRVLETGSISTLYFRSIEKKSHHQTSRQLKIKK